MPGLVEKEQNLKQKIILGGALAMTSVCALWIGGAYYAGKSVEKTLDKQYQWLTEQSYFVLKDRTYERGWFSSTEKATLAINPEIYRFLLEKEGEPLPVFEVAYTNRILHGPFPLIGQFNPRPAKAVVQTELQFSSETQKLLSRFFGNKKPIEVQNRIGFGDDGVIDLRIPDFDYEEAISGIKVRWQGLSATIDYDSDFNEIKVLARAPGLDGSASDKGQFSFRNLEFSVDHARGKAGLMLGETRAKLASFTLDIPDQSPLKISLDNLAYAGKLSGDGDFINGEVDIRLDKLVLNEQPYGPAELQAEATHLHGPTLARLNEEFTRLQKTRMSREALTDEIIKLAKTHGMPLLTNDPRLGIRKFEMKMPDGTFRFSAGIGLKGFQEKDLVNPVQFIGKLSAKADFTVPRKIVETLVMWQARSMFGGPQSNVSDADLDFLAGQFVEGQINRLADQKLIKVEGDLLTAAATLEDGEFTLNDILVPLPWQEEQPRERHSVARQ